MTGAGPRFDDPDGGLLAWALPSRGAFWLGGAVIGALTAVLLPDEELRLFAGLLGWLAVGLLGEILQIVRLLRTPSHPELTLDTRPADGRVDVAPVVGAKRLLNPEDRRFGRFDAWDDLVEVPKPSRRPRSARGFPPLLGRVVVVSFFLGRDGRAWTDREIARAHKALAKAGEWIETQAIHAQATVNLELADTYFAAVDPSPRSEVEIAFVQEGDETVPDEADPALTAVAATGRAARTIGFRDVVDLTEQVRRRVEADVVVWLVHSASAGRSRAVPQIDTGLLGVHLAVCQAREEDFPGPLVGEPFSDPITFVHELLHLFGAQDKYGIPLHKFPRGEVTERDVMRLDTESLARLRVDPRTARELGWPVVSQTPRR